MMYECLTINDVFVCFFFIFVFHTDTATPVKHTLLLAAPTAMTVRCACYGGITTVSFLASVWASVTTVTS